MQLRQNFNLHGFPAVKRLEENIEAQNEEKKYFRGVLVWSKNMLRCIRAASTSC